LWKNYNNHRTATSTSRLEYPQTEGNMLPTPIQPVKITLTPVTPISLTLTPVGVPGILPFAEIKRDFGDFKALASTFTDFAELKASSLPLAPSG
jgi:hypothetical protein